MDDCKSQLVVDSMTLESNFEVEKRKAEEEIATLQRLVHGKYLFKKFYEKIFKYTSTVKVISEVIVSSSS